MAEDPFVTSQQQPPHIYRPIPRRTFNNNTSSESTAQSLAQNQSQSQTQSHSQSHPQAPSDEPQDLWTQNTPPTLIHSRNRSSDFLAQLNARLLRSAHNSRNGYAQEYGDSGAPSRNKSYLDMNGSTLYGIYDEVGSNLGTTGDRSVIETPWGTGAETPARHYSTDSNYSLDPSNGWENGVGSPDGGLTMRTRRRGTGAEPTESHGHKTRSKNHTKPQRSGVMRLAVTGGKLSALFVFGVVYGVIVSHLHDRRELAAVNVGVDQESWLYFTSWGIFGISLGSLLPYLDIIWNGEPSSDLVEAEEDDAESSESSLGEQWNDVVRSIGAFVGIAFAIRRLPWQSTLQLTLTLALVNPALWYILDRSKLGFSFSLITTSILTSFIFLSNPNVLPSPALPATNNATRVSASPRAQASSTYNGQDELFAGLVSYDNLATVTWVGSVIFCSCVCFGGIGRRLAVLEGFGNGSWKIRTR